MSKPQIDLEQCYQLKYLGDAFNMMQGKIYWVYGIKDDNLKWLVAGRGIFPKEDFESPDQSVGEKEKKDEC